MAKGGNRKEEKRETGEMGRRGMGERQCRGRKETGGDGGGLEEEHTTF